MQGTVFTRFADLPPPPRSPFLKEPPRLPREAVSLLEALWRRGWGSGLTLAPQLVAGQVLVAVRGFLLRDFREGEKAAASKGVAVREIVLKR